MFSLANKKVIDNKNDKKDSQNNNIAEICSKNTKNKENLSELKIKESFIVVYEPVDFNCCNTYFKRLSKYTFKSYPAKNLNKEILLYELYKMEKQGVDDIETKTTENQIDQTKTKILEKLEDFNNQHQDIDKKVFFKSYSNNFDFKQK